MSLNELSRDKSNPGGGGKSSKKNAPPPNNKTLHDFFATATNKKKVAVETTAAPESTNTTASSEPNHQDSSVTTTDWQTKYLKLQQILQDKEEQLKAVTNNKTILHTALQAALGKTKKELQDLQTSNKHRHATTSKILEDLLRWKSAQQAKELREKLASDGARLGRIVYARAGMRALESWEEGYATKEMDQRKQELKQKRKTLEHRLQSSNDKENQTQLEIVEAKESIQMHLENLRNQEQELKDEENALNDEKGAHIRALKRVASEDGSRFRSRPKVRPKHCVF